MPATHLFWMILCTMRSVVRSLLLSTCLKMPLRLGSWGVGEVKPRPGPGPGLGSGPGGPQTHLVGVRAVPVGHDLCLAMAHQVHLGMQLGQGLNHPSPPAHSPSPHLEVVQELSCD